MTKIQSILIMPSFKTHYWMKEEGKKSKKISQAKWFELYDQSGVEVLAPLTIE